MTPTNLPDAQMITPPDSIHARTTGTTAELDRERHTRKWGRIKMLAILATCLAPVIASYVTYYVIKPTGRTNYGTIIDPLLAPVPADLTLVGLDNKPVQISDVAGKWIMVQVNGAVCDKACEYKLFQMRQLRTMQGKDRDRIERLWLITDKGQLSADILKEYPGMLLWRADAAQLDKWLPVDNGTQITDHIYLIDPISHLMMRFPKNAVPQKVQKDLKKLLAASSIG